MSKAIVTKWTLVGGVVLALALSGCGNRVPTNVPDEEAPTPEVTTPATPAIDPAPAPVAPPVTTNPGYVAPTTGSLVVSGVEKKKSGLVFFKHMTVKGSVVNTSNVALSGTIKVEFKEKKGIFTKTFVTEETKTQVISQLAPGQSFPFEIKSDESGIDDAEVTVETMAPAPTAAAGYGAAQTNSTYSY